MIWVILLVAVLIVVIGVWLSDNLSEFGGVLIVGGCVIGGISLIAAALMIITASQMSVMDEKITMYSEENAKIESQLAQAVEQYQEYETNVFQSVAPESAMTLVALYPELKADALVEAQMDVYIDNNAKIKALKEEKINEPIYRWWLYFGR